MGGGSSKMAEEMAVARIERRAEETAQLHMKMMAFKEAMLHMERMTEREAQRDKERMAFKEAMLHMEKMAEREAKRDKERRAEREAQLRMKMMAEEMAQLRNDMRAEREVQRDKERMTEETAQLRMKMITEEMAQLRMEMRAEREAQRDKERMTEETAQLRMKMRAEREAQRDKERMATGRPESPDSGVSLKSDQSKDELMNFKVSPRLGFFGCGVPDVEDFNKCLDNLITEETAQLRKEMMTKGRMKSINSGVSFKTHRSKGDVTNFKDRVSVMPDSSSSEEKHNVSDDEDLFESPDNLGREMN